MKASYSIICVLLDNSATCATRIRVLDSAILLGQDGNEQDLSSCYGNVEDPFLHGRTFNSTSL